MKLDEVGRLFRRNLKDHSSIIFSVAAGVGTIATAYLAGKASFRAANIIREHEEEHGTNIHTKERIKERTKLVWKLYIPTATSAVSTIACIVGANRMEVKKTVAAQTAFAVSERVYSEYRDKVIEEFGAHKDQSIRDKVVAERVKNNPPPSSDILVTGPGNILCCELFTGRYFASDMESLNKAKNEVNSKVLKHDYATLDDFYYLINLRQTSASGHIGWRSNRLMELEFSTVLSDDGRPCLAFEYNYTTPL